MPQTNHQLFDPDLVDDYLSSVWGEPPDDVAEIRSSVENWTGSVSDHLGERNLQQSFLGDIFGDVLEYRQPSPGQQSFDLLPEEFASGGEGFPDVLLGHFEQADETLETDIRKVVGELKGPGTDLEKVDAGSLRSPVEQGFKYAITNGLSVRWVVVSNMDVIRLYHHGSMNHYVEWELGRFIRDDELTDHFWEFYHVMHREYLIGEGSGSQVENLLAENLSERLSLTEDFYGYYRDAIQDTYSVIIDEKPELAESDERQLKAIRSAQTLIHRGLVICFFADHPGNLLPDDLLEEVIQRGKDLPTLEENKIYPLLNDLFRVIDTGSPDDYPYDIYGYDGGLFEEDEVLNNIVLPDELFTRDYEVGEHTIEGIFGFHRYNFQTELNEHVLGRIFEESVGDIEQVRENLSEGDSPFSGVTTREDYGLYYTREGLTEFVSERAIEDLLQDKRREVRDRLDVSKGEVESGSVNKEFLDEYLNEIINIRIADIACGSGAFLVSCFGHLQREAKRVHEKLRSAQEGQITLRSFNQTEIDILDQCLHGNDILTESVELSKLSVWLKSARKDTSLGMLTGNFASQDALAGEVQFEEREDTAGFGEFDLVIGNPPWGAEVSEAAEDYMNAEYGDEFDTSELDTYEMFILVALEYLNDGGRLAYVLPQTLLNPDHTDTRKHLLDNYTLERFHMLGADWFGPDIRMNTVTLQVRNEEPDENNIFKSMNLVEEDRRQAIEGELNLSQLESAYSFEIPQQRCIDSGEIEPFRYRADDSVIETMNEHSIPLGAFCESHRGVELNKAGHIIKCPACGIWLPPPLSTKPDAKKTCTDCEAEFEFQQKMDEAHIVHDDPPDGNVLWMDGDSFGERFDPLGIGSLDLGYRGIKYKDEEIYRGDKVFIRQAGVGLSVAYHEDTVYCPQSVYIYKIRDDREDMVEWYEDEVDSWTDPDNIPDGVGTGTHHKFLLGVLSSRIFHYYVFKRFGEIDAAQAFAKLTQTKIRSLPIPVEKMSTEEGQELVNEVAEKVETLLGGDAELGGETDWGIDTALRDLYGLSPDDMLHISQQMGLVAYHQTMQQLYPGGKPPRPEGKSEVTVDIDSEADVADVAGD